MFTASACIYIRSATNENNVLYHMCAHMVLNSCQALPVTNVVSSTHIAARWNWRCTMNDDKYFFGNYRIYTFSSYDEILSSFPFALNKTIDGSDKSSIFHSDKILSRFAYFSVRNTAVFIYVANTLKRTKTIGFLEH